MRRFSAMKKESSVTREIKLQAESIHRRLNVLYKQIQKSEEQYGPTAAPTRIQRSQHASLHRKFKQVGDILLILEAVLRSLALSETFICLIKDSLDSCLNIKLITSVPEPEGR